jgi:hypothetical protein
VRESFPELSAAGERTKQMRSEIVSVCVCGLLRHSNGIQKEDAGEFKRAHESIEFIISVGGIA